MKLKTLLNHLAVAALLCCATARAELVPVTEDIASGTDVTWYGTNTYLLNTVVYVQSNAVLRIEPKERWSRRLSSRWKGMT